MLGAVIGDIIGSRFEWNNIKTKDFTLFTDKCEPTDDTFMTLAVARALTEWRKGRGYLEKNVVIAMQHFGRRYPYGGYGGMFSDWLASNNPKPYNSFGNGAAMRISPAAYAGEDIEQVKSLSQEITSTTHNHPEGIKGAEATAVAVYLARTGVNKEKIREIIENDYYSLPVSIDEIRDGYYYDVTCQGTVPAAMQCFFDSTDYVDAIRNAISIGGDSDTLAAICGGIAGAYYEIGLDVKKEAIRFLDDFLINVIIDFQKTFGCHFI